MKKIKNIQIKFLLLIFIITTLNSYSQFYTGLHMDFGKNRVQYKDDRVWNLFQFKKFDTYFYEQGQELATYASAYAYDEILRLEEIFDTKLTNKVRLIVFNDISDIKETNIGLITEENYNVGGITHVIDNKVFVYFSGNHTDFNQQITRGIAQVFINQIMHGDNLGSEIKNSHMMSFPDWYINGLISFLAEDWNSEINLKVKDGISSEKYKKFNRLSNHEQIIAGHSIWKYISDVYGSKTITDILYMSKVNRSVESGFLFTFGITFDGLMEDWFNHYKKLYSKSENIDYEDIGSNLLSRNTFLSIGNKSKIRYDNLAVSYDGNYAAYTTNEIGKVKLIIRDLRTNKKKTILKYGYKLDDKVDYYYPILAWAPNGNYLSVIYEDKNRNLIETYDVEEKKWRQKRYLMNFERVLSFSFNDKANELVMSAVVLGQTDIYIYNLGANSVKQITNDIYDDLNPKFVNNSQHIIYSSNNPHDSLAWDVETNKSIRRDTIRGLDNRDIFIIAVNDESPKFKRLTNTPYFNETYPIGLGQNKFSWLSNENGIYNKYVAKFDSVISYIDTTTHYRYTTDYKPLTNYNHNILKQFHTKGSGKITEVIKVGENYKLFIKDKPEFQDAKNLELQKTWHQKIKLRNIKIQDSLQKIKELEKSDTTLIEKKKEEELEKEKEEEVKSKQFRVIYMGSSENKTQDNYKKNTEPTKKEEEEEKVKPQLSEKLFKPKNYYTQFFINNLTSQLDFDYMSFSYQPFTNPSYPIYLNQGLNAFIKLGVMDLLEDRRITGGVKVSPNLRNNEYFLNYTYLKNRWDKEITLHRNVLETMTEYYILRHYIHEAFYKVSFPINRVLSWRSTINFQNLKVVPVSLDRNSLFQEDASFNRAGLKTEIVFDASIMPELNTFYGSRGKIWAEYFQPLNDLEQNTFVLGLDYRRYFKITKNLFWANRIAASTSFGTQKLIYYMGGVDNWLFPKFNEEIQVNPDENYAYQTLATNMRGFDQNIRNGNSFIAINSEIRWPIFRFFSYKPIKNNFLKHFMIVGFGDIGTAWTGSNPYSDNNSLYRHVVKREPIKITVINQNDPIVGGFGFGLRSQVFGYYIRGDWAWGIQSGYLQESKFYLSLSLDF